MITWLSCSSCSLSDYFESHWNCTVVVQSGQRSRLFVTVIVTYKLHDALQLFVLVVNFQIQVMEGRDNGRRRPERGPGPATPSLPQGGH